MSVTWSQKLFLNIDIKVLQRIFRGISYWKIKNSLILMITNRKTGLLQWHSGKESACNAGDVGLIPGLGRFPEERNGNQFQYSCLGNPRGRRAWRGTFQGLTKESDTTSLVAQTVKNPPAMRDTWVRSLGWEDALEKGKATHSSILAWRIPWTNKLSRLSP